MYQFFRKHRRFHAIAALFIPLLYTVICVAVDFFHTEECQKRSSEPLTKEDFYEKELCPACLFNAGHNSSQPELFCPALDTALIFLCNCAPPESAYVVSNEWASSILARAPPSSLTF